MSNDLISGIHMNKMTEYNNKIVPDIKQKITEIEFNINDNIKKYKYTLIWMGLPIHITFHCNNNKITECNVTDTYNSSTAYIRLYKLMEC